MIKKIKHIGVAVDDLQTARDFFQETFDLSTSDQENFGELIFSFIPTRFIFSFNKVIVFTGVGSICRNIAKYTLVKSPMQTVDNILANLLLPMLQTSKTFID